ncbi:DUF397 domain-containing protein [Actinomadura hibisca]|uniref:DUF397 domain-containing protein n=1 Tax=Actinomadura hibisca TaxID=68565 RepID=UPI0009FE8537|nr:DUF397 domain-containing protein [Actinomadura hibisca]
MPNVDPTAAKWRKSTHSGNTGGNCVEVASCGGHRTAVRDSKDPAGPRLAITGSAWRALHERITRGELDL